MYKINKSRSIFLLILLLNIDSVRAEQCPTPQVITDREISRELDWTIDEKRTIEDLLTVEKLYSVRIINKGEFIACYYSRPRGLLRLDGKPEKEVCLINITSGDWAVTENGEQVCKEDDLTLCIYEIKCE